MSNEDMDVGSKDIDANDLMSYEVRVSMPMRLYL